MSRALIFALFSLPAVASAGDPSPLFNARLTNPEIVAVGGGAIYNVGLGSRSSGIDVYGQLGLMGGRLELGYGYQDSSRWAPGLGVHLRASLLRTWWAPPLAEAGEVYAGGTLGLSLLWFTGGVGVYRADWGEGEDWLVTLGLGFGIGG